MSQEDLTDNELDAIGVWCAYWSAREGAAVSRYPDRYRLTPEQAQRVRLAEDSAIYGLRIVMANLLGDDWEERISQIDLMYRDGDPGQN